jgi:hypothetical protein
VKLEEGVPFAEGFSIDDVLAKLKDMERVEVGEDVRMSGYLEKRKP